MPWPSPPDQPAGPVQPVRGSGPAAALDGIVATPWLVDVSHVVMCVAMGFTLLLMI